MQAAEALFDVVGEEQLPGNAGIFAEDRINVLEGAERPEGDIRKIADGGRDEV